MLAASIPGHGNAARHRRRSAPREEHDGQHIVVASCVARLRTLERRERPGLQLVGDADQPADTRRAASRAGRWPAGPRRSTPAGATEPRGAPARSRPEGRELVEPVPAGPPMRLGHDAMSAWRSPRRRLPGLGRRPGPTRRWAVARAGPGVRGSSASPGMRSRGQVLVTASSTTAACCTDAGAGDRCPLPGPEPRPARRLGAGAAGPRPDRCRSPSPPSAMGTSPQSAARRRAR